MLFLFQITHTCMKGLIMSTVGAFRTHIDTALCGEKRG